MMMDSAIEHDVAAVARLEVVRRILEVVCRTTGMGFSAVARVTPERWVACAVRDQIDFGLGVGGELNVESTLCHEVRQSDQLIVIDDVATDEQYCDHHTPRQYGFRSYISVPIRLAGGRFFGTLCAIDPKPARLKSPERVEMFKLFAELIGQHLDAQERAARTEAALLNERETAKLREQFVAIVGHDLRNPLAAIGTSAELLRMLDPEAEEREAIDLIRRSVKRMSGLLDNVLDFARGRLGEGFVLSLAAETHLQSVLEQVVAELRSVWPERTVECDLAIDRPVECDSGRLAQMLSNLLANALTHGDVESDVWVRGRRDGEHLELSVTNRGKDIPPDVLPHLFEPFSRGVLRGNQEGLGLGLYISAEIAKAHEGRLTVTSTDGETRFTFRMPLVSQKE